MSLLIAFQEFEADGLTGVHVIEDFTRRSLLALHLLSSNFSLPRTLSLVNTFFSENTPRCTIAYKKLSLAANNEHSTHTTPW